MSIIRLSLLCALLAILPAANAGEPPSQQPAWLDHLRHGGYVIVLRHGATVSDGAKIDSMSRPVTGARPLNAEGRAQAKAIGASMRKLHIPVGLVVTSSIQRAVDTGTLLGLGAVTSTPDLAEGAPPDEKNRRTLAFRKLVATPPPADSNVVIVTHKPNIVAAFGDGWSDIREGEASVFEPDRHGGFKLIVRVQANEWTKWVHAAE